MNTYGTYNRDKNPLENFKFFYKNNNILIKLIIINIVVWLAVLIIDRAFDLFNSQSTDTIVQWLAVPASFGKLIFRPWTLVTYMFLHFEFWHILFNMLWLFWFGRIFLEYLNEKQLLATYLLGGLAGAAIFILSFNLFPKFQDIYANTPALGASASVMAIVIAISYYVPNYKMHLMFLGPVRIFYVAIAFIIMDIFMMKGDNAGGHLAHIGGAMWGFFYIYSLKKGKDYSSIISKIPRFSNPFKRNTKTQFKNVYTNEKPVSDEDYNLQKKKNQQKVDIILEKISKSGYDSLTKDEKELLFKTSNKNK